MAAIKRTKQGEALRKEGAAWIDRINAATKLEKDWLDDAERATKAYTGELKSDASPSTVTNLGDTYDFNILFSNIETIVPAIINSPPAPDIRRRFADDDPAAKDVSELIERAIRIQIDDSKLQVEMEAEAQDIFLAGRGIVRLRFKSEFVKDAKDDIAASKEAENAGRAVAKLEDVEARDGGESPALRDANGTGGNYAGGEPADAAPQLPERLANERVTFETVSWRDYRHGPAKRWDERPWEAFRFCIPREDEKDIFDGGMIVSQYDENDYKTRLETKDDLTGWEIWCRKTKKVKFVDDDGVILKTIDDPLGLLNFYCTATPAQAIEVTGRLKPVNPFAIYRKLADELDLTTKRINVITNHMKVKGWYSGASKELSNMLDANDVDFVPIAEPEMWAANGGLAGAVAFWPVEKFITVLRELYAAREQTKQAIYEITGISDIVRGASKSDETLGAQQIKTQWGSLRIQKMQRMLERTARDLFVMMAEIIPAKFSHETLQQMTGVQLIPTQQDLTPVQPPPPPQIPPGAQPDPQVMQQYEQAAAQAQQAEQARQQKLQKLQSIQQLLSQPLNRAYRIDVESDSTVKADLTRQKAEMTEFLAGAAQYWSSASAAIAEGTMTKEIAIEIFMSMARMFNLGKSVEDALEQFANQAKEESKQPPKPDPEMAKQQGEMALKQQEAEDKKALNDQEMQFRKEEHDLTMEEKRFDAQTKRETAAIQSRALKEKSRADSAKMRDERAGKRMEMGLPQEQDAPDPDIDLVKAITEQNANLVAQIGQLAAVMTQALTAPKRIVKDEAGRPVGVQTVMPQSQQPLQ